jgi:hypothetical protein
MSMSEILEEASKLSAEERHILVQKLNELEEGSLEESPELLAAIEEARAEPEATDVSGEELTRDVIRWAHTK